MQPDSIPAPTVPLLPVIVLAFSSGFVWHRKKQANKAIMDLKIMPVRFWTLKAFPISAHFDCKTFPKGNRHKYRQKLIRKHSQKLNSKCLGLPQNLLLCLQLFKKLSCSYRLQLLTLVLLLWIFKKSHRKLWEWDSSKVSCLLITMEWHLPDTAWWNREATCPLEVTLQWNSTGQQGYLVFSIVVDSSV